MNTKMTFLAALAAAVLLVTSPLAAQALGRGEAPASPTVAPSATPVSVAAPKSMQDVQLSFRDVAKKVLPVVVEIDVTEQAAQSRQQSSPFDFFFNFNNPNGRGNQQQQAPARQGLGSGIIIQRSGDTVYVLTNNHVVDSASTIKVKLNDQREFKGTVVGTDKRRDLAVVSFTSKEALPVATFGNSDALQVGDLVLAVGNPFGFESTVTMGIVSALGRSNPDPNTQTYTNYIQTDAAINEGNSGGALVDTNGDVVGINTWIAAPTGGSIGLGFAIPINVAASVMGDLMKGQVQYGWLGVQIGDPPNTELYAGYASDLKVEGVAGAQVFNLYKGSPAEKAGLLPGDYIVSFNGSAVKNADGLTQIVGGLPAGKSYPVELVRYGTRMKLSVSLGIRDPNDQVAQPQNLWPGMQVINMSDAARQQAAALGVDIPSSVQGLLVGQLGDGNTPAVIAGFKTGDVITAINGKAVRNMLDYYKALNAQKSVSFSVNRAGTESTISLTR